MNEIAPGTESFTGYSIVNAETMDAAVELAKTNPVITGVVVYELARMQKARPVMGILFA